MQNGASASYGVRLLSSFAGTHCTNPQRDGQYAWLHTMMMYMFTSHPSANDLNYIVQDQYITTKVNSTK